MVFVDPLQTKALREKQDEKENPQKAEVTK
jgi:hypothetical protein